MGETRASDGTLAKLDQFTEAGLLRLAFSDGPMGSTSQASRSNRASRPVILAEAIVMRNLRNLTHVVEYIIDNPGKRPNFVIQHQKLNETTQCVPHGIA